MGRFLGSSQPLSLEGGRIGLAIAIGLMGLAPVSSAADGCQFQTIPHPSIYRDGVNYRRDATASLVVSQVQSDDTTQQIVLELPLHGQSQPEDVMMQVEALVQQALVQQFQSSVGQPSGGVVGKSVGNAVKRVDRVHVMVLGNRNGTVLPMVSVTVSRAQWFQQPQAKAWFQYYASQSLLHPQAGQMTVAIAPPTGQPSGVSRPGKGAIANPPARAATIHQAFDDGQLTGAAAQDYLNDLD